MYKIIISIRTHELHMHVSSAKISTCVRLALEITTNFTLQEDAISVLTISEALVLYGNPRILTMTESVPARCKKLCRP